MQRSLSSRRRACRGPRGAVTPARGAAQAVADEVTSILDSGIDEKKLTDLKKGQPNIIMFVGLQARPVP